jgi:hypothetical protein
VKWVLNRLAALITLRARRRLRPDLRAFARTRQFARLQAAARAWSDAQFAALERAAPWLARLADEQVTTCQTGFQQQGVLRRGIPGVTCTRITTAVYSVDGQLSQRLAELERWMARQGWTDVTLQPGPTGQTSRTRPVTLDPDLMFVLAFWDPSSADPPLPAGIPAELKDRRSDPIGRRSAFRMEVAWADQSSGQDTIRKVPTAPRLPQADTVLFHAIEVSGDLAARIDSILGTHPQVLAVRASVDLYRNPNTRRQRLPRRRWGHG